MRSDQPLVSVIIPTYNRSQEVCRALESVFSQTYEPIEILVIDDGSDDGTEEALKKFGSDIVYIRQCNAGVSAARNRGILESNGDVVTFLDSDDLWLPHKTEEQIALLNRTGEEVPCCICDTIMRYSDYETTFFSLNKLMADRSKGLWTNVFEVGSARFAFLVQSLAIRREFIDREKIFDEALWVMEDHEFCMRLAKSGPWAYTNQSLVVWHGGSRNSLCVQAQEDPERYHACLVELYEKMLDELDIDSVRSRRAIEHQLHMSALLRKAHQYSKNKKRVLSSAMAGYVRLANAVWRRLPGRNPSIDVEPVLV